MSSVQNNQSNPLQNQNLTWTTVKQGADTIYEGKNWLDFKKIKNFCYTKEMVKKIKRQAKD